MTPELLFLLGLIGALVSIGTVYGGLTGSINPNAGMIGAITGAIIWIVFAYGSLSVDIGVDDGGSIVSTAYEPLAWAGMLGALVLVLVAVFAAVEVVK